MRYLPLICCVLFISSKAPMIYHVPSPNALLCIQAIVPENMRFIPEKYLLEIAKASVKYKVPMIYLARLLREESNFDPDAINYNDNGTIDLGIAQLNNKYIPEYVWKYNHMQPIDPFNPKTAIHIAAAILANNYRVLKDWKNSVMAYNCGLSKVRSGNIPVKTRAYAIRIIGA